MEQGAQALMDMMLRLENLVTMAACWIAVGAFGRVFPSFAKSTIGARLQPLAPIGFCSAAVWLPGLQPDDMPLGMRVMLGVILGFGAGHMHKILKQTGFGSDSRIKTRGETLEPLKK
jgi:hypothetical protein